MLRISPAALLLLILSALQILSVPALAAPAPAQSRWLHTRPDGKLVYTRSPQGDRIPDFSSAGYHGGGVGLPSVPTRKTVAPTGADDTTAIQAALDAVANLPPDANGSRGAVQLAPGTFHLAATLHITASGVVLRGASDSGTTASTLELTGAPHLAIQIKGDFHERDLAPATTLTDPYIPAGATIIHVADASHIHPGDTLLITKPVTPAWIHFMQMDHLTRDGKPQVWINTDIKVRRRVASVAGNAIALEVPLTDSFDSRFYPGAQPPVVPIEVTGQIAETGIENLRIAAPDRSVDLNHDATFNGVQMDNLVDSWLRSVAFENTTNSVTIGANAERMTILQVDVTQHAAVSSAAKPADFSLNGAQILLDRCTGKGDSVFYVVTQPRSEGPVVVLHCRFLGDGHIEPHQRWSTGLLIDNCEVPGGGIDLMNRGSMGSGHGWTIGWSVLWNNTTGEITVQNPPGVLNWSIGDQGDQKSASMPTPGQPNNNPLLERGVVESEGKHVQPASLYLQQLRDRLGPKAVAAIGYK